MAVDYYLAHGKCYARIFKKLGYLSRVVFKKMGQIIGIPFKRNRVNLTSNEREAGVLTLLIRHTSAQEVANDIDVSRFPLYNYKEQLLVESFFGRLKTNYLTESLVWVSLSKALSTKLDDYLVWYN